MLVLLRTPIDPLVEAEAVKQGGVLGEGLRIDAQKTRREAPQLEWKGHRESQHYV
jgi:hypothetical protein